MQPIKKKTPPQVFLRNITKYYKIFRNSYFKENLRTASTGIALFFKGTVMQLEKAMINDHLRFSKLF